MLARLFATGAVLLTAGLALAASKPAPAFSLKDLNGKTVDLQEKLGKDVIVLNFFATWCAPCQAELPVMQSIHEKYGKEGLSVFVVSIDDPKSAAKVKPLMREGRYTFPVLMDTQSKAVSLYNPKKVIPFSAIIDKSGNIHQQKFGFQPGDEVKLDEDLQKLLGTETGKSAPEAPAPVPAN